ncbi:MAG: hypothetical protein NTZ57_09650, partial [Deltaproteobacteria bacterium]|nr:hypothetical protein [Deltaproteobacteria bacterium]
KGIYSVFKITLPYEIADYVLNQKRMEISKLESIYDMSIFISGSPDLPWDELKSESVGRELPKDIVVEEEDQFLENEDFIESDDIEPAEGVNLETAAVDKSAGAAESSEAIAAPAKKKSRRRPRFRRKKHAEKQTDPTAETPPAEVIDGHGPESHSQPMKEAADDREVPGETEGPDNKHWIY